MTGGEPEPGGRAKDLGSPAGGTPLHRPGTPLIRASAFDRLDAAPSLVLNQPTARARLLPRCCGTYAFHGRGGDLLYIGKAANLRARILSHLRGRGGDGLLPHWTRLVTDVEVRPAASQTEALLVEADLIGKLKPAFNRRMREWSRYCYLRATGDTAAPLEVVFDLSPPGRIFGPFRTRRQALAVVEAVFIATAVLGGGTQSLERLYAVLTGGDDRPVRELEERCDMLPDPRMADPGGRNLWRTASVLRRAFEHARLLRRAEALLGAVLIFPGRPGEITCAMIGPRGLCLRTVGGDGGIVEGFLDLARRLAREVSERPRQPLPRSILDLLTVAAARTAIEGETRTGRPGVAAVASVGRRQFAEPSQECAALSPVPPPSRFHPAL